MGAGDLQVVADGGSGTRVEARESWSFSRVRHSERVVDDVLQLRASCPTWYGECGLSYVVHVAPGTSVRARTGSGDVQVAGVGAVDLQASSGDVRVRDTTGELVLRTGSGDLRVTGARAGRVSARAGSGDVDLALVDGAGRPHRLDRVGRPHGPAAGRRLPRAPTRTGSGDEQVRVRRDGASSADPDRAHRLRRPGAQPGLTACSV